MQRQKWLLAFASLRKDEESARECLNDEEKGKWNRVLILRREERIAIGSPIETSSSTPVATMSSRASSTVNFGTASLPSQSNSLNSVRHDTSIAATLSNVTSSPPQVGGDTAVAAAAATLGSPSAGGGGGGASSPRSGGSEGNTAAAEAPSPELVRAASSSSFHIFRNEKNVLGRGQFGTVYRGFDNLSGLTVAVKETQLSAAHRKSIHDAMQAEFAILTKLDHPNIVKVFAFSTFEDTAQIIMEWMPSGSVHELVWKTGFRVHESVVRRFVKQALQGLAYLHSKGILHRDIKPENMLVSGSGEVKLSDFGTCRQTLMQGQTAMTNRTVGTPCYLSPEALHGKYSCSSDVWAIACSAVAMASRATPWSHLSAELQEPLPLMFHIGSGSGSDHHPVIPSTLSSELQTLLRRCFDLDPSKRPTADVLLEDPYFASSAATLPPSAESLDDFEAQAAMFRQESQSAF